MSINQNDAGEKGQQVAMMGDVYALGKHNLIWLGDIQGIAGIRALVNAYNGPKG